MRSPPSSPPPTSRSSALGGDAGDRRNAVERGGEQPSVCEARTSRKTRATSRPVARTAWARTFSIAVPLCSSGGMAAFDVNGVMMPLRTTERPTCDARRFAVLRWYFGFWRCAGL